MSTAPIATNLNNELGEAFRQAGFHSAEELRREAIGFLETTGLPQGKAEEYRFTPIYKSLEKNFTAAHFATVTAHEISSVDEFNIPDYESNLIVFVNGEFNKKLSRIISPKEQLVIQSLHDALDEPSSWAHSQFGKLIDGKSDPFAALNAAFWRDGICLRVPDGMALEKPIVVLYVHDAAREKVVSATRLLMQLGKKSSAVLVERFDSVGVNPVFNSVAEEISLSEGAELSFCRIQNDPGAFYQVTNTLIHQADTSRVNTFTFTMNGKLVRNNFGIEVDGSLCESHFYGLYLLDRDTLADNHTMVDHRKPNSFSNQLYKGVMDGNSKGVFNGKIYVRPHAQKTNAFQSNRNILLTDTATINTKPQLEIWADDVKCSHGCTTGQLDEEGLFYLQSRGISKSSALTMLLSAFAGEVLDPVKDPVLREFLDRLITKRLQKSPIS